MCYCAPHSRLVVMSCFLCLFVSVAQLAEARDKTLECLNQTLEYKELKGTDPSITELVKRIEQVTPH